MLQELLIKMASPFSILKLVVLSIEKKTSMTEVEKTTLMRMNGFKDYPGIFILFNILHCLVYTQILILRLVTNLS
jgi:hypothetical protein